MDDDGIDDDHGHDDHGHDKHGHDQPHGDGHKGHKHGAGCNHGHGAHEQDHGGDGLCDEEHGPNTSEREAEVRRVDARKTKGFSNRVRVLKENTISRFKHSIDPTHVVIDEHGHSKPFEFKTPHKTGAVLGATAALGVAIHGGVNIKRGVAGYEDSLGEKHEASARTFLVGVGEVIGGAALFTRALSGRWMP